MVLFRETFLCLVTSSDFFLGLSRAKLKNEPNTEPSVRPIEIMLLASNIREKRHRFRRMICKQNTTLDKEKLTAATPRNIQGRR